MVVVPRTTAAVECVSGKRDSLCLFVVFCGLFFLMSEAIQGRLTIFLNGHARQVGATITLGELARECGLDPRQLLVELNRETLPRDAWPDRGLQHGDRVEFIRVVAGG
jgi:sulfur carrier protein